jgi:hypothetical protein
MQTIKREEGVGAQGKEEARYGDEEGKSKALRVQPSDRGRKFSHLFLQICIYIYIYVYV